MNPDRRRLSALVVNYCSGEFAVNCVESLVREWRHEQRDPGDLEIVVVDNASPRDQTEPLDRIEALGASVIRSRENRGYAGGVNLALSRTSGGPQDVVAILNPDLFFMGGNVATLMDYVGEHRECGVVAPRAAIDQLGVLCLPKNPLPTIREELGMLGAQVSTVLARSYSRRRLETAIPWWTSSEPIVTDMLSGCCLFLRREVVGRLPSLMDERFPLYYEDTDLFRSLGRLGYTVVQHTGTTILHHWSRSCGHGETFVGEPQRRYLISRERYFAKYYGRLGSMLVAGIGMLSKAWPGRLSHRPMHPIEDLGRVAEPIEIVLPRPCRFLIELGMAPNWLLAVGITGEGDRWRCPAKSWEWFFETPYFLRALDLGTGEVLGAWRFEKSTEGRATPLEPHEIAELRRPALEEAAS